MNKAAGEFIYCYWDAIEGKYSYYVLHGKTQQIVFESQVRFLLSRGMVLEQLETRKKP